MPHDDQTSHEAAQPEQPGQPAEEKPRRRTSRRASNPPETSLPPQESPEGTMVRPDLGHGGAGTAEPAAMQRAEDLIDRMGDRISQFVGQARGEAAAHEGVGAAEPGAGQAGERVGRFVSQLGLGAVRAAARAREELEDIWAEAQHVRRGDRQP